MEIDMKKFRHKLEFFFALLFCCFFRLFSIKVASNIGGFLGRTLGFFVGRFTGDNEKAFRALEFAFPGLSSAEKTAIAKKSYENIGRFIAEYVNQYKMDEKYFRENVELINSEMLIKSLKAGCFGVTAHFGNWEVMQRYVHSQGVDLSVIYNPLKNPEIDKLYLKQREIKQIPKGTNSMKKLMEILKNKKSLGILLDQRDKAGEILEFFGRPARTSTAIPRLSLKYNYKMVPVKCLRRKDNPNKFIMQAYSPLKITPTGNFEEDVKALTLESLKMLEEWIRENPENWLLWFYSRWRTNF